MYLGIFSANTGFTLKKIMYYTNGCKIYVDIVSGEKLSSMLVAKMDLIEVRSSSRGEGQGINGVEWEKSLFSLTLLENI